MFPSVICPVFQACGQFDLQLSFSNESHNSNYSNETMGKTAYNVFRYSFIAVLAVGMPGNILVIISLLRQKILLKNNYYFLVLHLAMCDLGALIIYLLDGIASYWFEESLHNRFFMYCFFFTKTYVFQVAGTVMMLIISVLRYRATVQPLKPAISRRKLKFVCGLVYLFGLVAGYGVFLPECSTPNNPFSKFRNACTIFFLDAPTIFMAVAYYKVGRALMEQKKHMKSVCSNPSRPNPPFSILKFIQNRRIFLVCLITVLCQGTGNIPLSVHLILVIAEEYHIVTKSIWFIYLANVLRVAGSISANPLIYGILDKKLLTYWKLCRKKKQRPQEN